MAENRGNSNEWHQHGDEIGLLGMISRDEPPNAKHWNRSFESIEDEAEQSVFASEDSSDICCADVLRAVLANVDAFGPRDDQPKWNASTDEADCDQDDPEWCAHAEIRLELWVD